MEENDNNKEKYYNRPSKNRTYKIFVFALIWMIILLFVIIALEINEPVIEP